MGKLAIVLSLAAVIACGKSGSGGDSAQRALCERLIEKSGGCCGGLTPEEKKIGIDACVAEKLDDAKRATIDCALATPCEELMTGKACGGFRCKTKAANVDLCRKLIAKSDECCDFTPEDEATGLAQCEKADLTSDQRQLVDCVIATSCTDLLAGTACGGFRCKNK
jgi:hypothetical protein